MMRYYCDVCNTEVSEKDGSISGRFSSDDLFLNGKGKLCVGIITGTESTWNLGIICKSCILKLVKQLLGAKE